MPTLYDRQRAQEEEEALRRRARFNVSNPFGSATWNNETNTLESTLSPDQEAYRIAAQAIIPNIGTYLNQSPQDTAEFGRIHTTLRNQNQEELERRRQALESRLSYSGIAPGSNAYTQAMGDLYKAGRSADDSSYISAFNQAGEHLKGQRNFALGALGALNSNIRDPMANMGNLTDYNGLSNPYERQYAEELGTQRGNEKRDFAKSMLERQQAFGKEMNESNQSFKKQLNLDNQSFGREMELGRQKFKKETIAEQMRHEREREERMIALQRELDTKRGKRSVWGSVLGALGTAAGAVVGGPIGSAVGGWVGRKLGGK
ncbi:hypothetical protein AGMMS49592_0310 [Endomicrobiia bacterium]|nr:hypothetical protein AGMMS49592_0310 [Endomicrobiia bacterium]